MLDSIPLNLRIAMGAGVGLFIGFIGLKNGGIIVANGATFLSLGDFTNQGTLLAGLSFLLISILSIRKIPGAIIIGILFIIIFNLYAYGIQKVGISITTVANKMSLIIPVGAALILYPERENFTLIKYLAFFLALIGIYLTSTKSGELNFKKKYIGLIILIFIGQGFSDAVFNDFAQSYSKFLEKESFLFFMTLFSIASVTGIIMHFINFQYRKIKITNLIWGILFGIPNFFSLFFFLKALKDPQISSTQVFPLTSMGIIISTSLVGLLIFKEKISNNNWIGILLSICAIYLFTYK